MPTRSVCVRGIFATAVFLAAYPVGALTISGVTIAVAGTNSPDDTVTSHTNNTSATSILAAGGIVADTVAANVSAKTRYASNLWADAGLFDPAENVITTNSYDMSLSVNAGTGITYDIDIETVFQGILVREDEDGGCFFCTQQSAAGVSAVQVEINSVVSVPHATSAQLLALGYYDASVAFSELGNSSLTGLTGTTNLSFNVIWTSNADNTEGDEAAVLLGLDEAGSPIGGVTGGEYGNLTGPGSPGDARDMNLDGHFIEVIATVTAIPEPSTALLLATGLAIIAVRRRRG